jgi:hypothetical protein
VGSSKRADNIDRSPCPAGKCEHRAFLHRDGICLICRDKAKLNEPGDWNCKEDT